MIQTSVDQNDQVAMTLFKIPAVLTVTRFCISLMEEDQ